MKTKGSENENARIKNLYSYHILDSIAEEEYDFITQIASEICGMPVSLISLVDQNRQWFKSHHGLDICQSPKEHSFCAHAIVSKEEIFVVPDSRKDPRFKDNPLVTADPHIVFYVGVTLISSEGFPLGTLCVIDHQPRTISKKQISALKGLAKQVVKLFELRKSQHRLNRIEERYKVLVDHSIDGIYLLEEDGTILEVNNTACEMLGFSKKERINTNITDCDVHNNKLNFIQFWSKYDGYQTKLFETVHRHKNGTLIPLEINGISFIQGGKKYIYCIGRDISKRKETEKRLRESEEHYRFMTEYSSEMVCLHEPDGTYRYVSPAVKNLLGYDPEELVGTNPYSLFHPDDQERIRQNSHRLNLEGKGSRDTEYRIRRKNGKYIWFETTSDAITDQAGETKYLTTTSRDISERIKAELALKENEEKYRFLAENTSDFVILMNAQGAFTYIPPNIAELTGFSVEEHYKMGSFENILPEDRKIVEDIMREINQGAEISRDKFVAEYRIYKKSGEVIWLQTRSRVIRNDKQEMINILSTSNDITQRKEAEHSLKESEKKFRQLFDNMNEAFALNKIITDKNGKPRDYIFTEINPYFEKVLGLKREDVLGKRVKELLPDTEAYWIEKFGKVALEGKPIEFTDYSVEFDRYFATKAYCPKYGYFAVTFTDITDKIKTEKALKEAELRYRTFINSVSEGVYRFDFTIPMDIRMPIDQQIKHLYHNAYLEECNEEFLKVYGLKEEDMLGMSLADFHGGDDIPENVAAVKKFILSGYRVAQEETVEPDKEGNLHHFSNNTVGIIDKNNRLTRFWGTQTDITKLKEYEKELIKAKEIAEQKERELKEKNERIAQQNQVYVDTNQELSESNAKIKQINQELQKANQELDNFVYRVSHDLRSPVASCLALIDLALQEEDQDQIREFMKMQEKSLSKQDKFIHDILDYSRNTRKKVEPDEVNLRQLIDEIISSLSHDYRNTHCSFKLSGEGKLVCDSMRLQMVLNNLIANAFKYSFFQEKPHVQISASINDENTIITIKDNGIGIPDKHQKLVFDMFYRATNRSNGSGLGLYIVKEALDKMQGSIDLTSKVGEGTSISIQLPNLVNLTKYKVNS
ncbi:PAS domain S-box-containing protein [Catalinimonas alkaloidigena]|uniref:PAS domain S-box protein n=1 Tax=Catalinimonas alkaloidigena TaxID=1075417 RepID=UPI002404C2E6|nr:PAS domain S-box protein [Catalinimonas alkaloidigena]MDF9797583.1 PAS domain S-box-containing protein [Catalinimonas alkaloidigena]